MKANANSFRLRVFSPQSKVVITKENAARLDTLQRKTVCEIWATGHWSAHLTFPVIRELLQSRFPDLRFVPYTEFPSGYTWAYPIPLDKLGEVLKEKGCDAVLLGNGG